MPDIRLAMPHDLPAVERVVAGAYSHYVERMGRKPGPMTDDYRSLIGSGQVHVIDTDGSVRAILVLIPEDDALLLDNIAVDPSAQGMGLGGQLLRHAEQVAVSFGYRVIRLYTNEAMTENIGIYARIGYVETHRAEENGLRRVYMAKALG